jgi:hypothetical protein
MLEIKNECQHPFLLGPKKDGIHDEIPIEAYLESWNFIH